MNIILHELKSNLKGFIIWAVSLGLLFWVASFEYEFMANSQEIAAAMESFDFLFEALAGTMVDITTPEGYLSLVSIYIYLPLAIYSGLLGSNIIAKEERDKTAEYLFTLPVKREKVILNKLVVALFYTVIINVVLLTITYFAFGQLGTSSSYNAFVFNMALGVLLTQLIFMGLGMAVSAILEQYKKAGSITIGILMGTFMLSILIGLTDKIDFMKYFTPFKYFSVDLMLEGDFKLIFIIIAFVLIIGSISSVFYFYKKRDLFI
ncbi:ABC transporter permease subunit [Candidatus Izemoplasma sp. B36]|uniref:ABC transporter permease subunit n=1 Tax=Candidatus Izemoplasma sp. B36 TaxID=3242468 RepID=UPI0035582C3A